MHLMHVICDLPVLYVQLLKAQLFVEEFFEKQLYSFLDYISSGFELNFMVAVDFTGINHLSYFFLCFYVHLAFSS